MHRRKFLKGAAGLFVAAAPAIIRPIRADAQLLNLKFGAPIAAPSATGIPLSWEDTRFSTNAQETTYRTYNTPLSSSRTFTNKDWDSRPTMWNATVPDPDNDPLGNQFLQIEFAADMQVICNQCRGYWREGYRVNGSGPNAKLTLNECYTQMVGITHPTTGVDHADGVQSLCTGVTVEAINSVFRCCDDTNAALQLEPPPSGGVTGSGTDAFRWADNSTGTIVFNGVMIRGNGRGVSIFADSGTTNINWTNVYFVDEDASASLPSGGTPNYRGSMGQRGGALNIVNWNNVCLATIVGGEIVPGAAIPSPDGWNWGADDYGW